MGARGPSSAAAIAVTGADRAHDTPLERAPAPDDLSPSEAAVWAAIVGALPPEDVPLQRHADLANYCRHVVSQSVIARVVHKLEQRADRDDFDLKAYDQALKMRERETRAIASLSVRLGFAYSTSYDRRKSKPAPARKKPWE